MAAGASRAAQIGLGHDNKEPCRVKSETLFRRRGGGVSPNGNMTPPGLPPAWVLVLIETLNNLLGLQQAKDEMIYNSAENPCDASASPNCNT